MHLITLKPGTGLFVECPVCRTRSRLVGSNWVKVTFAFESSEQEVEGECASCHSVIRWSPTNAKVATIP